MSSVEQNEAAARRCIDLFNKGNTDWLDICYAPDARWIEHPHLGNPSGVTGDLETFRKTAEWQMSFFPDRRLTIIDVIAQGNKVVLLEDWEGTAAMPFGHRPAGSVGKLRIATFLTFDDNALIIHHEDFIAMKQS